MGETALPLSLNRRAVALVRSLIAKVNARHRAGSAMAIAMMEAISTRSVVSVFISIVSSFRTMRATVPLIKFVAFTETLFERSSASLKTLVIGLARVSDSS